MQYLQNKNVPLERDWSVSNNLFPIRFLVDKVKKNNNKKKKNRKIVICRIMKNFFTITAAGVTQCEFGINMQI